MDRAPIDYVKDSLVLIARDGLGRSDSGSTIIGKNAMSLSARLFNTLAYAAKYNTVKLKENC